jgi:thiamine kinase-like enzyme
MMSEEEQVIKNDVIKLVEEFKHMDGECLKITKLPGMSNDVYKVECEDHEVIYKRLKEKGEVDLYTMHEDTVRRIISMNKLGPKTYFEDKIKIVEEYISGKTLTRELVDD